MEQSQYFTREKHSLPHKQNKFNFGLFLINLLKISSKRNCRQLSHNSLIGVKNITVQSQYLEYWNK
jgi:hypothetical protein